MDTSPQIPVKTPAPTHQKEVLPFHLKHHQPAEIQVETVTQSEIHAETPRELIIESVTEDQLKHVIYSNLFFTPGSLTIFQGRPDSITSSSDSIPKSTEKGGVHHAYVEAQVKLLLSKDYDLAILQNPNGHLCTSYPNEIMVPALDDIDFHDTFSLINIARFARVRGRFPVPTILFQNKYFARSATLTFPGGVLWDKTRHLFRMKWTSSSKKTTSGKDPVNPEDKKKKTPAKKPKKRVVPVIEPPKSSPVPSSSTSSTSSSTSTALSPTPPSKSVAHPMLKVFDNTNCPLTDPQKRKGVKTFAMYTPWKAVPQRTQDLRETDITYLDSLGINHVCNLMLQQQRKVWKFTVCSSEHYEDKRMYHKSGFISSLIPFGGVEAFSALEKVRLQHLNDEDSDYNWPPQVPWKSTLFPKDKTLKRLDSWLSKITPQQIEASLNACFHHNSTTAPATVTKVDETVTVDKASLICSNLDDDYEDEVVTNVTTTKKTVETTENIEIEIPTVPSELLETETSQTSQTSQNQTESPDSTTSTKNQPISKRRPSKPIPPVPELQEWHKFDDIFIDLLNPHSRDVHPHLHHETLLTDFLQLDFSKIRSASIYQVISHYTLYLLWSMMHPKTTGIVLHCLSGWDRTPFYCSLVRISLWADGLIHKSLDVDDFLYLTLGYDWFLFYHKCTDRERSQSRVIYHCFDFLPFLASPRFSCHVLDKILNTLVEKSTQPLEEVLKQRYDKLEKLFTRFMTLYNVVFPKGQAST